MSIWTCKPAACAVALPRARALTAATAVLLLAGCLGEGPGGGLGFLSSPPDDGPASAKVSAKVSASAGKPRPGAGLFKALVPPPRMQHKKVLASGRVVVTGPPGYCIDSGATARRSGGNFALLASCQVLSNGRDGRDVPPLVMTVQVQPRVPGRTLPTGRVLADGLKPTRVLHAETGDGMSLVHLAEGGDRSLPSVDPRHWRAALMVNGHLVGLALYAPKGSAAAGSTGRQRIIALAEAILAASPIKHYRPITTQPAKPAARATDSIAKPPHADNPKQDQRRGLAKLFPKLFQ